MAGAKKNDLKTRRNDGDVEHFLEGIADPDRRSDCRVLRDLLAKATGESPAMWGGSIVGFGTYHYRTAGGQEGDWFLAGFSPRKQALTLYVMSGTAGHEDLLARLGKFKTGKSCLYVKKLEDIHLPTLRALVQASLRKLKAHLKAQAAETAPCRGSADR